MKPCDAINSIPLAQRGSMSIVFVGMFLPLLFFLFTLSLDVATYYTDSAKVQAALDETALYAYRFLPNVAAAEDAANAYAARFKGLNGLSVEITDSVVLLRVERRTHLTFARLVGVTDATLPLSVVSRARGAPVDAMIVLDTSSSVAPLFGSSHWGDVSLWPAAQYFDDLGGVSARAKTQRCFNPVFSALKRTAIDAYRFLGASSVNSLGLGFYTGDTASEITFARAVAPLPRLPSVPPEVSFVGFADPYVGPSLCAAAAESEYNAIQYRFGESSQAFVPRGDFTNRPNFRVLASSRSLDPDYAPYLQGEELIWSQAASSAAAQNFNAGFRTALLSILAGDRALGRGGLSGKPSRVLFWLAAQLPTEQGVAFGSSGDAAVRSGIQNSFVGLQTALGDTGLTVFYVVMRNPYTGFTPSESTLAALQQEMLLAVASAGIPAGRVNIKVLGVEDPSVLTEQLSRWIAITNRTSVVAL